MVEICILFDKFCNFCLFSFFFCFQVCWIFHPIKQCNQISADPFIILGAGMEICWITMAVIDTSGWCLYGRMPNAHKPCDWITECRYFASHPDKSGQGDIAFICKVRRKNSIILPHFFFLYFGHLDNSAGNTFWDGQSDESFWYFYNVWLTIIWGFLCTFQLTLRY